MNKGTDSDEDICLIWKIRDLPQNGFQMPAFPSVRIFCQPNPHGFFLESIAEPADVFATPDLTSSCEAMRDQCDKLDPISAARLIFISVGIVVRCIGTSVA
jgi:hypothetical protein